MYKTKIWYEEYIRYGIPQNVNLPEKHASLIDLFATNTNTDKPAFYSQDEVLNFTDLREKSLSFTSFLQQSDLSPQSRIAVMLPNLWQYPVVCLGILSAGHILVNVNPHYTKHELTYQLNDAQVDVIILINEKRTLFNEMKIDNAIKAFITTTIMDSIHSVGESEVTITQNPTDTYQLDQILAQYSSESYHRPDLNLDSIALLQYTGGTTGISKGTILTYSNLYGNVLQCDAIFSEKLAQSKVTNKILCALPLYHIFGFTVCCLFGIYKGLSTVLIRVC